MIPVPIIEDIYMDRFGFAEIEVMEDCEWPCSGGLLHFRMVDNDPTRLEPAE